MIRHLHGPSSSPPLVHQHPLNANTPTLLDANKLSQLVTMGIVTKSVVAGLVGAAAVSGACIGPNANAATVSLVAEFEGFSPDICE